MCWERKNALVENENTPYILPSTVKQEQLTQKNLLRIRQLYNNIRTCQLLMVTDQLITPNC